MQKVQRANGGRGDRKIFAAASSLSPGLQSFGHHRTNDARAVVFGVRQEYVIDSCRRSIVTIQRNLLISVDIYLLHPDATPKAAAL